MNVLRRALHQLLVSVDYLLPSTLAPKDQAVLLAAMEGRDYEAPVSTSEGEAGVETGHTTTAPTSLVGAGGLSGDGTTASERRPVPAQTPEGGRHLDPGARPPAIETFADWSPHPCHRQLFTDERLAALLTQWGATS